MKFLLYTVLLPLFVFDVPSNYSSHLQNIFQHAPLPTESNMDILASDGIKLKATYYSPGKPGPGILLLHQCNMDRKAWQSLATSLVNNGIHVLTFDYRGYGESPAGGNLYEHIAADVDSAMAKLILQPGVDKMRIAAGGASCGVSNSLRLAIRNDKIKALFLLTGPIPKEGVNYIESHRDVPVFAIENGDEVAAVRELDAIIKLSKHPASTMKAYLNGAHGVAIFKKHAEIIPAVTNWMVGVLK
jgi:pimeloyl-ACP methyl ester carboxylesterase